MARFPKQPKPARAPSGRAQQTVSGVPHNNCLSHAGSRREPPSGSRCPFSRTQLLAACGQVRCLTLAVPSPSFCCRLAASDSAPGLKASTTAGLLGDQGQTTWSRIWSPGWQRKPFRLGRRSERRRRACTLDPQARLLGEHAPVSCHLLTKPRVQPVVWKTSKHQDAE